MKIGTSKKNNSKHQLTDYNKNLLSVSQNSISSKRKMKNKNLFDRHPFFVRELISENEDQLLKNSIPETITILSFFATSLFQKKSIDAVYWDIVENCISQLNLEDCVIYHIEDNMLVQKAAYGNKCIEVKKILSPIKISIGKGIVGSVAKRGRYELIKNTLQDNRYIVDDLKRQSELAVPIFVDQKIIGVLDSEHSKSDFFTENHAFLFQLISRLIEKKIKQLSQKNTAVITDNNTHYKKLNELMSCKKIYTNANLSLDYVAEKLNISGNYVSQLINKLCECNFSDYINNYRVQDAKLKLKDKQFSQYTILSIGLESGFNSKSTFYSAFKKHTGVSPTEFRKKAMKMS